MFTSLRPALEKSAQFSAARQVVEVVLLRAVRLRLDVGRRGAAAATGDRGDDGPKASGLRLPGVASIDAVNNLLPGVVRAGVKTDPLNVLMNAVATALHADLG